MKSFAICLVFVALMLGGCVNGRHGAVPTNIREEVRRVLDKQIAEWNASNLEGFMETYAKSGSMRFASGGDVSFGWETMFERYRRKYGEKETMGILKFSDIDIQVLGPDSALAFGRWHLTRAGG